VQRMSSTGLRSWWSVVTMRTTSPLRAAEFSEKSLVVNETHSWV